MLIKTLKLLFIFFLLVIVFGCPQPVLDGWIKVILSDALSGTFYFYVFEDKYDVYVYDPDNLPIAGNSFTVSDGEGKAKARDIDDPDESTIFTGDEKYYIVCMFSPDSTGDDYFCYEKVTINGNMEIEVDYDDMDIYIQPLSIIPIYFGEWTVDSGHKIYVEIYYDATSDPGGDPDANGNLSSNSGFVSFTDVTFPAYVFTYWDENGDGVYAVPDPCGDLSVDSYDSYFIDLN